MNSVSVVFHPIGILRSPHARPAATPIQPIFAEECLGRAELRPEFADGLAGLEGFSHGAPAGIDGDDAATRGVMPLASRPTAGQRPGPHRAAHPRGKGVDGHRALVAPGAGADADRSRRGLGRRGVSAGVGE